MSKTKRNINAIELTEKQKVIARYSLLTDKTIQYINVSTGRQCGKSTICSQIALNWCINTDNYKVGFFSPVYRQCKEQFNRLKKMLKGIDTIKFNKSELLIEFPNGSTIQFLSADNDNSRGFTFDSIIVDEACFVKDEIFDSSILPTVAISIGRKRGKVILASTPKEKNYFYKRFNDESPNSVSITFTSFEGGLYTKEFLEDVRRNTPDVIFRNEYLAEFMDGGSGIFEYKDSIATHEITSKHNCTAGLDFGMENDYTVLTIQNGDGELCFLKRWRKIDWDYLLDEIVDILKEHGSPLVHCETNGIGNMPYKTLYKKYGKARAWVTSTNKTDIIMKLAQDIKAGRVKIPNIPWLLDELDDYTFTFENGKMKFNAKNGSHDDAIMSLAICNANRVKLGVSFV